MNFKTIEDASKHVLGKYCSFLNQLNEDYLVIGGLGPYLELSSNVVYRQHPHLRNQAISDS